MGDSIALELVDEKTDLEEHPLDRPAPARVEHAEESFDKATLAPKLPAYVMHA